MLTPTNLKTSLVQFAILILQSLGIQQVKDFLVVNLQERCIDVDCLRLFGGLSLCKHLFDSADCQSVLSKLVVDLDFAGSFLTFTLFILVTFHCEGLSGACLSIGKDCSVETLDNFADQASYLQLLEDFLLAVLRVYDLVKLVVLACPC